MCFKGSKNLQVVSERVALLLLILWSLSWSLTPVVMEHGHSLVIPPHFDGNNYAYWKVRMKAFLKSIDESVRDRAPGPFLWMLGQTHVNGWSRVIASQNGGLTSYIFPFRLGVLQWSRHLFNYWKNKKTIIEKFLILLIWNLIYIDHRKITWLWS